jgi:hypothetical protein
MRAQAKNGLTSLDAATGGDRVWPGTGYAGDRVQAALKPFKAAP